MLNKFAVVPEHFILATRDFKPQTHVLEESDLQATLACIEAYNGELFTFFNSGQHSGASQPHRHIQLLPVARMREGLVGEWSVLADRKDLHAAPFAIFSESIRLDMPAAELHAAYLRLYRRACSAVGVEATNTGEARISYNLAMTKDTIALCPRVCEGGKVEKDGEHVGWLALNGTVLAGTALVKTEKEWDALRSDPGLLEDILRRIGLPKL